MAQSLRPYILVYKDPLLTYLLASVPSTLTLKYQPPAFQLLTSWWLNQPLLKNMLVELDHFPSAENKKYLKPSPNFCNH